MTLQWADNVSAAETDGGLVLLDQRSGRYFQLNATGSSMVKALVEGVGSQDLAERLSVEHGVSAERVSEDIASLVDQLRARGLLTSCE